MTSTWGIDMSTNARDIGVAKIDWSGGRGQLVDHERRPAKRDDLDWIVEMLAAASECGEHVAVDVPFGWPIEFGQFVSSHAKGPTNLAAFQRESPATSARPWSGLASRYTDDVVRESLSRGGLSVSFDKLGATAAAWAYIEHSLSERKIQVDRTGVGTLIFETWPSAAWQRLLAPPKQNPAKTANETFIGRLEPIVHIDPSFLPQSDGRSAHVKDAIVCAVVARCHALELTDPPHEGHEERIKSEGWIHLPTQRLDTIAEQLIAQP